MVFTNPNFKAGDVISFYPRQERYRYEDAVVTENNGNLEAKLSVISSSSLQTEVKGHYLSTITNETKPKADYEGKYTGTDINFNTADNLADAQAGTEGTQIKTATFNFARFNKDVLNDESGAFNKNKFPSLENLTFTYDADSDGEPDDTRSVVVDGDISNMLVNSNVKNVDLTGLQVPSNVTPIVDHVFPSTHAVTATVNEDQNLDSKVILFNNSETNAWVHSIPNPSNPKQVIVYVDHSIVNNINFFIDNRTSMLPTTGELDKNEIQLVKNGENKGKIDRTVTYTISNLTDSSSELDMKGLHIENIEFHYGIDNSTPVSVNTNFFKQDYTREPIVVSSNNDISFKFDRMPSDITSDESVVKYIWGITLDFLETWRRAEIKFTDTAGNELANESSVSFLSKKYELQTVFTKWVKAYTPINIYSASYDKDNPDTPVINKENIPNGSLLQIDVNETAEYNSVPLNPTLIPSTNTWKNNFDLQEPTRIEGKAIYDVNLQATFYPAQTIQFTSLNEDTYHTTSNGYYVAIYDVNYILDTTSADNYSIVGSVNTILRTNRSFKPTITITANNPSSIVSYPKVAYIVMTMNDSEIFTVSKTLTFVDGAATIDLSSINMDMFINNTITVTVTMDPTTYGTAECPLTFTKANTLTNLQYADSIVATTNSINTGSKMYLSIKDDVLAGKGIGIFKSSPVVPGVKQTGVTLNIDLNKQTYNGNNNAQGSAGTVSQLFHMEEGATRKSGANANYNESTHKWDVVDGSGEENTFILSNANIGIASYPTYAFAMIFQLYVDNMKFTDVNVDTLNGSNTCWAYSQNSGFNTLTNVNIKTDQNFTHTAFDIDILNGSYGRNFADFVSGSVFGASAVYVENKLHAGFNTFASKQQAVIAGKATLDNTNFDNFQFGLIIRNGSIFDKSYIMSSSNIIESGIPCNIQAYLAYCNNEEKPLAFNDRDSWLHFMMDTCIYVADKNYVAVIHEITDDEIANTDFYRNYAKVSKSYGWNDAENTQRKVIRIINKQQDIIYKSNNYDVYTVAAINSDAKASYGNDVTASFTITANNANVVDGTVKCIVNGNNYNATYITDHWEATIDKKEITGSIIVTVYYNTITYTSADESVYVVVTNPEIQTLVGSKSNIPVSFNLTNVSSGAEITTGTVVVASESKTANAVCVNGLWSADIKLDAAINKDVVVTVTYTALP